MSSPTISLFLPSLEGGGAERVFVQLANEFITLGCCVDLVLTAARGPYFDELSKGVRVLDLRASGVLSALPKLVRYLRSKRPAVILSGLDHANIIAITARALSGNGIRCVVSTRSVPTAVYRGDRGLRRWITLQISRIAYRFADRIIANSQAVASDLSQSLGISRKKLTIIYNPLDIGGIDRSSRIAVPHPWLVSGSPPIILSVGSLGVLKDFQTLIRAFALVRSMRHCRLVILGEGPERENLESLIQRLDLQKDAYLPGFVTNPFPWMRHANVFVSSSLTEGCPNALMQALACGIPVVSTNCVGGSAEVLQEGKWGRLIAVGDYRAMAEAIVSTLEATIHPDVRQRANDFAHDRIARQYLQILLPNYIFPSMEQGR